MSALWRQPPDPSDRGVLAPMSVDRLDAVMAVEVAAYAFPWTRGNFVDSLAAGHSASTLWGHCGDLLGYYVAMAGVDEMHLLNLTVAPDVQRLGHASRLFAALRARCRQLQLPELWLEVRQSNAGARAIYTHWGFVQVGVRRGYYPAPQGRREDAAVMSLRLPPRVAPRADALD